MVGGDAQQRAEGGGPCAAAVEAEHEFVEVGLEMPAAQAVIDAERPDFKVGKDAVPPRQHDMGSDLANQTGIVGGTGISGPSVGLGRRPDCAVLDDEGMQAGGRVVGQFGKTDAAGSGTTLLDLDGADDQHFALVAAPAAGQRLVLAAAGDLGFVDLDQARERVAVGATMLRRSLPQISQAVL